MRKLSIEKSKLEAKENLNMVEKNTLDNITKEIKKLKEIYESKKMTSSTYKEQIIHNEIQQISQNLSKEFKLF